MSTSADAVATAASHLTAAKYFQLASFVMLVYDHFITLGPEIERIWKRKVTGASILFLINRYGTPLQFAFIVNAFNDPTWSSEFCAKVVSFEGYTTVALVAVCELIMILRIFALFSRNYYILGFLLVILVAQIVVSSYGLSLGFPVPLPPGFVGCIFTGPNKSIFPAVWYTPAITDFVIFCLTVYRARAFFQSQSAAIPTIARFVQDGVLYFLVIFGANLLNVLLYTLAVDDLKAVGASFSQCISSIMISRLVLNLRAVGESRTADTFLGRRMQFASQSSKSASAQDDSGWTRTLGPLGGDVRPWGEAALPTTFNTVATPPHVQQYKEMNTFELAQISNGKGSQAVAV